MSCAQDAFVEKCRSIQVGKDRLYHFRKSFGKGDVVDIHSKRQFERECAKRGQIPITKDDVLKNGQPYQPTPRRVDAALVARTFHTVKQGG